jgi:hypothetical protein
MVHRIFRLFGGVIGIFLVSTVLAGCEALLQLVDGVQISCETNEDCPEGMVCREALNRCVDVDTIEGVAPGLEGSAALTALDSAGNPVDRTVIPDFADGTTAVLTFTVDEALAAIADNPRVRIVFEAEGSDAFELNEAESDPEAGQYVFFYPVRSTAPEGTHLIEIDLTDQSGNSRGDAHIGF